MLCLESSSSPQYLFYIDSYRTKRVLKLLDKKNEPPFHTFHGYGKMNYSFLINSTNPPPAHLKWYQCFKILFFELNEFIFTTNIQLFSALVTYFLDFILIWILFTVLAANVKNDLCSGRPTEVATSDIIETVRDMVLAEWRSKWREIL